MNPQKSSLHKERLHAMDAIRAAMMLLGVLFHCACTYTVSTVKDVWPVYDPRTALGFDLFVSIVHCFRMPLFFVVSGFFTAMLARERGLSAMLWNRLFRIGIPFLLFLPLVFASTYFSMAFFKLYQAGQPHPALSAFYAILSAKVWQRFNTLHLWFLYYLLWLSAGGFLATLLIRKCIGLRWRKVEGGFGLLLSNWWSPLLFSALTLICLGWSGSTSIDTDVRFLIDAKVLLTYAVFFGFGWQVYTQRFRISRFKRHDRVSALLGLALLVIKFFVLESMPPQNDRWLLMTADALACWLLIFGLTGLFFRFCDRLSPAGRYLSDASYWIYLVHLPLLIFFQALLTGVPLPAFIKFIIVVAMTLAVTLLSYNFAVRSTGIGKLLNGRKYARGLPGRVRE